MKSWRVLVAAILLLTIFALPLYANTVSEEAKKSFSEGIEIIKKAVGYRDFLDAENKIEEAISLAPTWAEPYYNLALICEEIGKEFKAIKSYKKYLEFAKDASDRTEVESSIEKLKKSRQMKKEIGLAGINLIALKDGIYVKSVLKGSKLAKAGFQAGDRVVEVNKRSAVGIKLEEFYRLIKNASENPMLNARVQAYGRNTGMIAPVAFQIVRGGRSQVIVAPLDTFKTNIYEIEEDNLEEEVLRSNKPVLLVFWADWCSFCRELIPIIDDLADKYMDEIRFLTISADYNKKAAANFQIKAIPSAIYFRNGQLINSFTGKRTQEEIEEFLKTAVDRRTQGIESSVKEKSKQSEIAKTENGASSLKAIPLKILPGQKIGMVIQPTPEQDGLRILQIFPNSVAEKSGLKVGDLIVRINGLDLKGVSSEEFVRHLRSEETIILYILRENNE